MGRFTLPLIAVCALLGRATCEPPTRAAPHAASTAASSWPESHAESASAQPHPEPAADVTYNQVIAGLDGLCQSAGRAATAALTSSLAAIQKSLAAVSGRLDVMEKRLGALEHSEVEAAGRLKRLDDVAKISNRLAESQTEVSNRLAEFQTEAFSRLDAVQTALSAERDGLRRWQTETDNTLTSIHQRLGNLTGDIGDRHASVESTPTALPAQSPVQTQQDNIQVITDSLPTCGGRPELEGTILSPNYPRDYPNSTDVIWTIVAEPGQTIRAHITDFALETDNERCTNYDHVQFRDGYSVHAPSLATICGNTYPLTVGPTTTNALTIVLHTNPTTTARGFNITWKICGAETALTGGALGACDAATEHSGGIQSINYPYNYANGRDATWNLVATHPDRRFSLEFRDFRLESCTHCICDSLHIIETSGTFAGSFCGSTVPAPYGPSRHPALKLEMHADGSNSGRGFSAQWTAACRTTAAAGPGRGL